MGLLSQRIQVAARRREPLGAQVGSRAKLGHQSLGLWHALEHQAFAFSSAE
jgi:hypothetical protein